MAKLNLKQKENTTGELKSAENSATIAKKGSKSGAKYTNHLGIKRIVNIEQVAEKLVERDSCTSAWYNLVKGDELIDGPWEVDSQWLWL